jgi:hypothetical protein
MRSRVAQGGARGFEMNLSLLDPFYLAQDHPDSLTGSLSAFPLAVLLTEQAVVTHYV